MGWDGMGWDGEMGWDGMGWEGEREMVMVMVMEKITRHLLSGGRMLDLWPLQRPRQLARSKVPSSITPKFFCAYE